MVESSKSNIQPYRLVQSKNVELGVDPGAAMAKLARIPICLHCWQGHDVGGFEGSSGGMAVAGNSRV